MYICRLFHKDQPFEQIESQHSKTQQGTGLGLALTKSLIEMHCGRIDFQSEPGQGTRFRVWLPRIPPEASPPAEAPEPPISSEVNHESPPHPAP